MNAASNPELEAGVERQRLESLYARLPNNIASMLIGVLLVFVFLMPTLPPEILKAWAAYMLTTLAIRGWLWQQFRVSLIPTHRLRLWEWLYAGGMGLTGLGWMVLCGPMFPTTPELQNFVWVMIIFVAFSGMVLVASSRIAFITFIIPTLLPGLYRFYEMTGEGLHAIVAAAACTAVILITHNGLRGFSLDHLRRQVQAEQLLAEQQAIFQGATIGIAIFDGGVMGKCNKRFGELFGRGLTAMQKTHAIELFMQPEEGERFIEWARGEFDAGRPAQSMERMRRADGSQFWAEISGRQLRYGDNVRNLWMVTDATMRQGTQR